MLEGPSIFMKQRMLVKDFDILNKGEVLKLQGILGKDMSLDGFILLSKSDLRPYIGKEVEITAKWDIEKSSAKQKYLKCFKHQGSKKTNNQTGNNPTKASKTGRLLPCKLDNIKVHENKGSFFNGFLYFLMNLLGKLKSGPPKW